MAPVLHRRSIWTPHRSQRYCRSHRSCRSNPQDLGPPVTCAPQIGCLQQVPRNADDSFESPSQNQHAHVYVSHACHICITCMYTPVPNGMQMHTRHVMHIYLITMQICIYNYLIVYYLDI